MNYYSEIELKDGRSCILRSVRADDAAEVLWVMRLCHEETDFLLTYPDETKYTEQEEREFLDAREKSGNETEIVAVVDGRIVGMAGINAVGSTCKVRHRAEFGVCILKEFCGIGIGKALTSACVECARNAGYRQLELDVVADNLPALSLYKDIGFTEFGRNPMGFNSRFTGFQELIYMRLEL